MTKPLTKEELVRSAWITALRAQGDRQCHGYGAELGDKVCAMVLLTEITKSDLRLSRAGADAGLSEIQTWRVIAMNDGRDYECVGPKFESVRCRRKHTFSEIADEVESWFQK